MAWATTRCLIAGTLSGYHGGMTESVVDRAARALAAHESGSDDWNAHDEAFKETIRESVRVVLRSVRDCTEDMAEAVHASEDWVDDSPDWVWETMIDAALREP